MTTTVAQGRSWDTTYRVLTASRLTGRQQEYPAATRHLTRSLLFGDLRSVFAEADGEVGAREDAIVKYGALISRDVAKVSTLDYLDPGDRAELVVRLAPRYLRSPAYTAKAPMSERQLSYLVALKHEPGWGWSWVRASVEIDIALGRSPGEMARDWMVGQGVSPAAAREAVDAACREAGVTNPAAQPEPDVPSVAADWDTAATLDAARCERNSAARGRETASVTRATAATRDAAASAGVAVGDVSREEGIAHIHEVLRQIRDRFGESAPARGRSRSDPDGVAVPPPMDEEEQERAEQLAREAVQDWAERARHSGVREW